MRAQTSPAVLDVLRRRLTGRSAASVLPEDTVRTAAGLVAAGHRVALDHGPGEDDPLGELHALIALVDAAGLAASCELTLPLDRLAGGAARSLAAAARDTGLDVALSGPPEPVRGLAAELPAAGVEVPVTWPDAEEHCRALAAGRVRLAGGRSRWAGRPGADADLTFVRCLNVLMAGTGRPGVGTTDPRLVAIAGERAAWNDRSPDSWEYVMPWEVRIPDQRRLLAGGYTVRVAVASGTAVAAQLVSAPVGGR